LNAEDCAMVLMLLLKFLIYSVQSAIQINLRAFSRPVLSDQSNVLM